MGHGPQSATTWQSRSDAADRRGRTWADFACLAIEQFKTQLTAFVGFPFIIATLLGAWYFLRPDLQAIASIVGQNAQITSNQAEITRDQSQMTKALVDSQKQMSEMVVELRQLLKESRQKQ